MKKTFLMVAILFAAIFSHAQAESKDTTSKTPATAQTAVKPDEKLNKVLVDAFNKTGDDLSKFLTKAHWDATMTILGQYLKEALDNYSRKETKPVPKN